jgi:hypothetical protein
MTTEKNNKPEKLKKGFAYWKKMTFKGRMARFFVKLKDKRKAAFSVKMPEINSMQKRAIELFMALLKSRETSLNYSPESKIRFIESNHIWATMSSVTDSKCIINIIDESNDEEAHSHEVSIPKEYAYGMMDEFDLELEKRFRGIEAAKKRIVVDDLEKLIKQIKEEQDGRQTTITPR